jgi:hypothetical protein
MTIQTLSLVPGPVPAGEERRNSSTMHITVYLDGATWKWIDHTAETPAGVAVTGNAEFIPPEWFRVKGVNLTYDNSGLQAQAYIVYDKKQSGVTFKNIPEWLNTGSIHPIEITRIDLSSSTVTTIHLHG